MAILSPGIQPTHIRFFIFVVNLKFIPDVRSVRISAMNATGNAPTVPLIKTTPDIHKT